MHDLLAILDSLGIAYELLTPGKRAAFDAILPPAQATSSSAVFLKKADAEAFRTPAAVFVVSRGAAAPEGIEATVAAVDHPRRVMQRVLSVIAPDEEVEAGTIDPTARIAEGAEIHPTVSIGPYSIIGRCVIGEGSRIGPYVRIHDGAVLGKRVQVREHCLIGGTGFGFVRDEDGTLARIPHVGGVVIEDDVELFPYANVDRGTLVPTTIRRGAKIDHYCHIGHNTSVGEDAIVTAGVVMCGSSRIGARTWIGVGSIIKEGVSVGDNATTGLGAVILRDVEPGGVVAGVPAKPLAPKT